MDSLSLSRVRANCVIRLMMKYVLPSFIIVMVSVGVRKVRIRTEVYIIPETTSSILLLGEAGWIQGGRWSTPRDTQLSKPRWTPGVPPHASQIRMRATTPAKSFPYRNQTNNHKSEEPMTKLEEKQKRGRVTTPKVLVLRLSG